ncbi:MAG: hypothetical protein A2Z11_02575 [Candidatus Woykebacteria bacterium RBG_16_43_9]|uniref:Uncharacterized protein n=1 Tax=Candidatus Woykebacteria bacterium RBG_16_43_9 TaxID=1802596 RepID=A0A1G1WFV0_9BACT|nr:MAG: hypothetical protein A2Z11_02575 [Candidatus Woykebacteria bacterium RBG_16_43_9]
MKFHEVTGYSKLLSLLLFIALPFIGFYLGMAYQRAVGDPEDNMLVVKTPKEATSSAKTVVDSEKVSLKTNFKNGLLKYSGTVQLPTPCHKLKKDVIVAESFPEQVQISLEIVEPDPGRVCTQVITEKEFSGELEVSENASVSVSINGEKVK